MGERITEWLKITLVPLLVFLIGACTWGCIQNTAAWRGLTEDGGGSARNEALGEVRSDSPRAISNNETAEDLETGLELSQVRCRDEGRAAVALNEVLVPSLQMRPWMETFAPIPTSETLAPIPTSEGDTFSVQYVSQWVEYPPAGSLRDFFEVQWFVLCEHAACTTFFGIFLAMVTTYAEVVTVFIFLVVNL